MTQCNDRIEIGRAEGGVHAEDDPDTDRDDDREPDAPRCDSGWHISDDRDHPWDEQTDTDPYQATRY